jgi:hypothetical protein
MIILKVTSLLEEHKKDIMMTSRFTSNLAFLHWHMQDQLILNDEGYYTCTPHPPLILNFY